MTMRQLIAPAHDGPIERDVTDLITPRIVQQQVDQILALPFAERPDATGALNQWLIEGLEQNRVENSGVCAKVALSVLEEQGEGP